MVYNKIMRIRTLLLAFFAVYLLAFSTPPNSYAKIISSQNSTVSSSETINDDLFISGQTVVVDGLIHGDVYAAGGTITVSGSVDGDVLATGGTVIITGNIGGNVRVVGGKIVIKDGQIAKNVSTIGGDVVLSPSSHILGSTQFIAGSYENDGTVEKNVVGVSGLAILNGVTNGNVEVGISTLSLGEKVKIKGNLVYSSPDRIVVPKNTVGGDVNYVLPALPRQDAKTDGFLASISGGFKIWSYLSALLVGIVFLYFFSPITTKISMQIKSNVSKTLIWGVSVSLLTIPFVVLLAFTIVGIPLAAILLLAFLLATYLAKIFVAIALGEYINKRFDLKSENPYLNFGVGLILIDIAMLIPIISFFTGIIVLCAGLGGVILVKKEYIVEGRKK